MLLKDLLNILRGEEPLVEVGDDFIKMLGRCGKMYGTVNEALWAGQMNEELRTKTSKRDIKLNKMERSIRRRVLTHLAMTTSSGSDIAYCFVLSSVVKDAERIGDYVKNLSEIPLISNTTIPESKLREDLKALSDETGRLLDRVAPVFRDSLRAEAEELVRGGRELAKTADNLLPAIAAANLNGAETTAMVLMTRFYKRISGHGVNILSSVIMPTHKIDFFDEDELDSVAE